MFETEFRFLKNLSMWSNALCLGVAEPITWLAVYIKAHTLRNQLGKQAFFKENEKNPWILEFFSRRITVFYLKVASYMSLRSIKSKAVVKLETSSAKSTFFTLSLRNKNNLHSSCFWLHLIARAASTLWQNSCKTLCPQKNICSRVYSYCNHSSLIFQAKVKIKTVYSDLYSTADVFLYSRSGCFCGAFKLFSDWFQC